MYYTVGLHLQASKPLGPAPRAAAKVIQSGEPQQRFAASSALKAFLAGLLATAGLIGANRYSHNTPLGQAAAAMEKNETLLSHARYNQQNISPLLKDAQTEQLRIIFQEHLKQTTRLIGHYQNSEVLLQALERSDLTAEDKAAVQDLFAQFEANTSARGRGRYTDYALSWNKGASATQQFHQLCDRVFAKYMTPDQLAVIKTESAQFFKAQSAQRTKEGLLVLAAVLAVGLTLISGVYAISESR